MVSFNQPTLNFKPRSPTIQLSNYLLWWGPGFSLDKCLIRNILLNFAEFEIQEDGNFLILDLFKGDIAAEFCYRPFVGFYCGCLQYHLLLFLFRSEMNFFI